MATPTYLIYLDDEHLDDPLYVSSIGRMMGRLRSRPRCLIVHGSGERAGRVLEAEGLFPEQQNGLIIPQTVQEAALVERAIRQVNRSVAGMLTEEGVPAVGLQGADRGLVRWDPDGSLGTGRSDWLDALMARGAVPVVSTLVQVPGGAPLREAPLAMVAQVLAERLAGDVHVVFLTRNDQPGIQEPDGFKATVGIHDVPAHVLPRQAPVRALLEAGVAVMVTSLAGLLGAETPHGTRISSREGR